MATSFQPEHDSEGGEIVAEINITPLTDVFLVLLIIFMVTTSVAQNQGKNIDLPGADLQDDTPRGVTVTVVPTRRVVPVDRRALRTISANSARSGISSASPSACL